MGKKGGGSKKGGSAAAAAAPRCTCDHPYQCNCGNRPERPSRGHKWYPDEQLWAGKGHKQKGGSGQTASLSKEAVVTSKGRTKIEQWQKLPSQLLADVCRKEKRPPPKYKALDNNNNTGTSGKHKYRCIVQDAKQSRRGGEHDLILIPRAAVDNEEQAREESALLALLQLTPKIPHERKLPEPYKTTWTNAVQALGEGGSSNSGGTSADTSKKTGGGGRKDEGGNTANSSKSNATNDRTRTTTTTTTQRGASATSSNLALSKSYSTASERRKQTDEKRRLRNARIAKHEAVRTANRDHQVHMSATVRRRIETLLRGDYTAALALGDDDDEEEDGDEGNTNGEDDARDEEGDEVRTYVVQRLGHEGFTSRQAKTAYKESVKTSGNDAGRGDVDERMDSVYEECLQWLCIHLDEDQLPEGFDPRGRTLDVVVAGSTKKKSGSSSKQNGVGGAGGKSSAVAKHVASFASKYGITDEEAECILKTADGDAEKAKTVLWTALNEAANVETQLTVQPSNEETNEILEEELEALHAIFPPEECTIKRESTSPDVGGKSTRIQITFPSDDGWKMQLDVLILDNQYPNVHPTVFVSGNWRNGGNHKLPQGVGTAVHIDLAKFMSTLALGDPMVYELYGFVQGILPSLPDGLSIPISSGNESLLLPHLEGGSVLAKVKSASSSNSQTKGSAASDGDKSKKKKADKSGRSAGRSTGRAPAQRRPREKSYFWSKKPKQTTAAIAFPKLSTSMEKARKGLPAARARAEFLTIMQKAESTGRVVLVTGETGCGKTTQIPQFILEEAPEDTKIVVAQPRRLAATGVANRVADERGETSPGKASVGYVVRGDVAMCNSTRLMFCTTGVLLRQLQSEGALECVTHIVVDEVHERHLDTDVLLGVLKTCLSSNPHLNVVLMSATMDADRFAAYWGKNTPRMHIPGYTYPVEDYTLEDVLQLTGYIPPKKGKKKNNRRFHNNSRGGGGKKSPWADSEWSDEEKGDGAEEEDASMADSLATSSSGKTNPQAPSIPIEDLVKRVDESNIDYDLIANLVGSLLQRKEANDDGSILVFLPGAPEIGKAEDAVRRIVRNSPMLILPLHGGLQPRDQQRVFSKADRGVTKVILSTNVAETSITIPDCTIVIDTCREKQSSYDPSNRMPLLLERFASRDSLKQRRGRAGRVQSGTCYKLISRATHAKLPEHGEPEIRRCALDQTLLSLLFLGVESGSGNFLGKLLDPPSQKSIDAAIFSLSSLGAVSGTGDGADRSLVLTPLGMHLAGIPAPPSVGKILVMGSLMGCRSAALAMAAGMSAGRSPFLKIDTFKFNRRKRDDEEESMEEYKQKKVLEARAELFKSVGNSDLAMLAAAFLQWDATGAGGGQKKKFCDSLGLSFIGMRDVKQLVRQLDSAISSSGFYGGKESDSNSKYWTIVRSCIVAALAPSQIVRVQRPGQKYAETAEGAVEKAGEAKELKFFARGDESESASTLNRRYNGIAEERVFMHPSSANFSVGNYSCPWLVYHQLVRTSKAFLRDATECSSYALLLFGGKLDVKASDELIVVDGYARLSANARIGALIGGLRRKVDDLLSNKVADPSLDIAGSTEMKIIVSLLKTDGLGH